jgi:hypothetical protein
MDSYLRDYCDEMSCGDCHLPEYMQWADLYEVLRHTYTPCSDASTHRCSGSRWEYKRMTLELLRGLNRSPCVIPPTKS